MRLPPHPQIGHGPELRLMPAARASLRHGGSLSKQTADATQKVLEAALA
jgi:hypothetical protein